MSIYDFMWVDAFTQTPMGGNGCAVLFDADQISKEARIAYVRESNLVECAYLQASEQADFGVRYYTAVDEILLAGHPTIVTCAALERAGLLAGRERFTLEVGAGVIPIEIDRSAGSTVFTMTQFAPRFLRDYPPAEIAALYGLNAEDLAGTPQTVSTGTAFCVTPLRDLETLRRAKLDVEAFAAYDPDRDFFEPFLCVAEGFSEIGNTAARLLLPPPMPPEDPFTGSATGCMACYLWAKGMIESRSFIAEQGHDMGRPGQAMVEVLGPRDAMTGVKVGGSGVIMMEGKVYL